MTGEELHDHDLDDTRKKAKLMGKSTAVGPSQPHSGPIEVPVANTQLQSSLMYHGATSKPEPLV